MVSMIPARRSIALLRGLLLVNEPHDLRNQFRRDDHDGLAFCQKSRFVLGCLFVFGLVVVVLGKLADALFIPSCGVCLFIFLGHFSTPGGVGYFEGRSAAGNGPHDKQRLLPGRHRVGQRRIRRLVGQILLAGEEPQERPAPA